MSENDPTLFRPTCLLFNRVPIFSPLKHKSSDLYYRPQVLRSAWYNKTAVKFLPPVFYEIVDLEQDSQIFQPDESEELYFDDFFRFTSLGQRILIQGRPGSGKSTLVNRLTKEWLNQTKNSKIAGMPSLVTSYTERVENGTT